ncbi:MULTISPECIES: type II toxin-antitoxin system VapC family toxin [unclassified Tolypothrix]|uniref:type II toxin-antitoxin system VapC family toxin n=1 Tax=unclassified Tolypothrix TaxID=2649714 RepID=UPI0005EAC7C7|nr:MULTISPECIES: type II toxin-antitoxin system VapC family toxin [unclassified Tolypothrix]BAY95452.1 PIN domain protein [Microchaete diplosiphon NIES-3275]EKF00698.1 nucleotide-binding PIN domain protein [Tolypothrix sp. PCC 7601]MBE9084590.1 type II toxin-antitoxin system VapC family toxin [Tolypothrix sp. LEGE 11397]UYD28643.1 type II toxin-antitoxin system VapC family toxin [Tolypothrix sp. PCC 7712]UYD35444.1 type II toxin-antitoxin system VapC family toxin [Tolypothrix sp. PCC 7601]
MTYLLDTDTCIYWIKDINSVRTKVREIGWEQISICSITVAELYFGAYNSQRIAENLARAEEFIQNLPVVPLNTPALKKFGELKAELRRLGQPITEFDLLIASVALTENYILVTNNTRHYNRITGLKLENWILP